jgi:hypothetical protein
LDTARVIWNRLAIVRPLRHRDFRLLWFGQTVSAFGNAIFGFALPFQILALGGSAVQLAIPAVRRLRWAETPRTS